MVNKTNKEILSQFGEEMNAAYKEKQERIKKVDELEAVSEPVKRQAREDIARAFYDKMEEVKGKPGYQEALKSARKEGAMRHKMHKAKKDYEMVQEAYRDAQIDYRGKVDEEIEVKDTRAELYGNKEKILKNLKENCVKVEENVEMMGYKGKKVYINLPVVGKFKGFKFSYFVSDRVLSCGEIQKNPELQEKSHSLADSYGLLGKIREYMKEMGVVIDSEMDYTKDLNHWVDGATYRCDAGDCLKNITGLSGLCSLKSRNVERDSHTFWFLGYKLSGGAQQNECEFYDNKNWYDDNKYYLFLRLS